MTAAALHAETVRPRYQAWLPLRWLVPLIAAWFALTYAFPAIQASGVPSTAPRLLIQILVALGLWVGLERTDLTGRQRLGVWLAVMVPYTLWLAIVWSAAINGAFLPDHFPPRLPLAIFIPVIIGVPIVLMSKRIGEVLDALPSHWLVGFQVYRVLGGVFLVAWMRGLIPGVFAVPAGIGDMTTGLLALPVAFLLAAGDAPGRRAAIAWNILGLTDFAVAISLGLMTSPGPLQLIVPSIPNALTGTYPTVLIPAFAVPSSILLHTLSLRQLRRAARRAVRYSSAGSSSPIQAAAG